MSLEGSGSTFSPESVKSESENVRHSVMSDSLQPRGLWPTRLLRPWGSPGRKTGVVAIPSSRGSS